ncbi:hypothetical protein [Streptomyces sp. NPDC051561]|uniref:hypothetical protein n=1 Tax=Streptomyces sp. NPDC051561 TaxID=3365658 RepID=UPI0037B6CC58
MFAEDSPSPAGLRAGDFAGRRRRSPNSGDRQPLLLWWGAAADRRRAPPQPEALMHSTPPRTPVLPQQDRASAVLTAPPSWLRDVLTLATGIDEDARVVGSAAAAALLTGEFGPAVPPAGGLIAVQQDHVVHVQQALHQAGLAQWQAVGDGPGAPDAPAVPGTREDFALILQWLSIGLDHAGAARVTEHRPGALDDAHVGRLRPVPGATHRAVNTATHLWHALYPALGSGGMLRTSEEIGHELQAIAPQSRTRPLSFPPAADTAVAAVLAWHQATPHHLHEVPLVQATELPDGDPWHAPDGQWRAWLQSVASPDTPDSSDPAIHAMLHAQTSEQKPTHQGWLTYQHALTAALLMDTSACPPADRRALRVAVLLHDVAKAHNHTVIGVHGAVGSTLWPQHCPLHLTDTEVPLVSWLIRTHDYLGIVDRTVKDPQVRGGMSLERVERDLSALGRPWEEALVLHRALYDADIGSVPALRHFLPLTPLLLDVVRAAHTPATPVQQYARSRPTPIVCFIGPPGAGKSTQIARLRRQIPGCEVLATKLLLTDPVRALLTADEQALLDREADHHARTHREGVLAPFAFDRVTFQLAARTVAPLLLMDGCPRGLEQARLYAKGPQYGQTLFVELTFPTDVAGQSVARQISRERAVRGTVTSQRRTRMDRRIATFLTTTTDGLAFLREAGAPVVTLDATRAEEDIAADLHQHLQSHFGPTAPTQGGTQWIPSPAHT